MHINIPYCKEQIKLEIPENNLLEIIDRSQGISAIGLNEKKLISDALKNPIGCPALKEMAKGKRDACILVSDITRPCPSYKFLPYLVEELKVSGVKNIKVIFGLGIHRSHTEEEKIKLIGPQVFKQVDAVDSNELDYRMLGTTSFGTPIEIARQALKSDLLIATGNIEYHYFAGYSGGAKAAMPGICTRNSIQANHSMMLEDNACAGNFTNNPVRQDIEEAGKIAAIDFIFNVILDDKKNIIAAVAGKNNEAFLEGIKIYDLFYSITTNKKADIVITSPGNYPKDINLYQAQKALENVKEIVKGGGEIILVASCSEGFGEDVFEEWMKDANNYEKLYKRIKEKFVLGGHKAVAVSKLMTKAKVSILSDFSTQVTNKIGFKNIDNLQEYLNNRIAKELDLKITIVPNGRFIKYIH